MKILAPINNIQLLPDLIEAGADELFFGFSNEDTTKQFGEFFELNRMSGYGKHANSFDLIGAIELVRAIGAAGKDSFVTLNSSGYTDAALQEIRTYVLALVEAGITGCIVSCPEMLNVVRQCGGRAVISCVGTVYNEADVRFYQSLGATRIIVPRDLSMDEIAMLKDQVPDMEYEAFIIRNGCILSDGNCLGLHRFDHGGICKDIRNADKQFYADAPSALMALQETQGLYDHCLFKQACAACAIYRMISVGVTACKVVGRVDRPEQVLEDIRFVHQNREIAMTSANEEEFFSRMVLPKNHESTCANGYNCYFPEIINRRVRR